MNHKSYNCSLLALSASSSSPDGGRSSQQQPQPAPLQHILLRRLSKRHGQIVLTMERLKFMMRYGDGDGGIR